jgi:hypothetical protein
MHIKRRRPHICLAEHHVDLAPMMRLMIEEMENSVRCGILAVLAQTISVTERPGEKPVIHLLKEGLNAGVFFNSRRSEFRESLEQDSVQWRCRTVSAGKPRHPNTIAQQYMVQQSVDAAERPRPFAAILGHIQFAALLIEPLIRGSVVTGKRSENIQRIHHPPAINRSKRKQRTSEIPEAALPRSSVRRAFPPR